MSTLIPERILIQAEEVAYRSAVSEVLLTRMGSTSNHINLYQYKHFEFGYMKSITNVGFASYNRNQTVPAVISNFEAFPGAAPQSEIVGINFEHDTSGSGGTTELDIEWSSQNSGVWATIFSTTPKVTSAAPSDAQFDTLGDAVTPTGCTVPVISKTVFNKGDRLRCKVLSLQTGLPNGFMMRIFYRPI